VTIGEAYAALGLDPSTATPDEARSRFRDLIRSNHPDGKPSHEQARANEKTRLIVEACALLRSEGFPRVMAGRHHTPEPNGLCYHRPSPGEAASADPFTWFDEMWRECAPVNLGGAASLGLQSVRVALGAWTIGWQLVYGVKRKGRR
jgi:curved DNA-binding protein CbpA